MHQTADTSFLARRGLDFGLVLGLVLGRVAFCGGEGFAVGLPMEIFGLGISVAIGCDDLDAGLS